MLGQQTTNMSGRGAVASVRGSVVDVRFDKDLPPIHSILRAGSEGRIVIEVLAQLDARHVRGIALTPTQGLARGMAVEDAGGPLKAPVGKEILSRMFDVFGNVIDRQAALSDVEWRSVHQAPPSLARRSTKSEVFETGIKVIDVLVPLERGGKAGLFGGAGVGKTGRCSGEYGDGVWPNERTSRCPLSGRPRRADDGRIFPRRRASRCAAAHRQYFSLHSGRHGSIWTDGADAVAVRLSADHGHGIVASGRAHRQH